MEDHELDREVRAIHIRRQMDERQAAAREKVRVALAEYSAELGGSMIVAQDKLDESDRRQIAASLAQVESAKRVLWLD